MTNHDTLELLRAKLNGTYHEPEPIFDQLYSAYLDGADYCDWGAGGIGRVIEQMETDTNPDKEHAANV